MTPEQIAENRESLWKQGEPEEWVYYIVALNTGKVQEAQFVKGEHLWWDCRGANDLEIFQDGKLVHVVAYKPLDPFPSEFVNKQETAA